MYPVVDQVSIKARWQRKVESLVTVIERYRFGVYRPTRQEKRDRRPIVVPVPHSILVEFGGDINPVSEWWEGDGVQQSVNFITKLLFKKY